MKYSIVAGVAASLSVHTAAPHRDSSTGASLGQRSGHVPPAKENDYQAGSAEMVADGPPALTHMLVAAACGGKSGMGRPTPGWTAYLRVSLHVDMHAHAGS